MKTPVSGRTLAWRTRHLPVTLHERILWLASLMNTTAEDIVNQALELGLDYMEVDYADTRGN